MAHSSWTTAEHEWHMRLAVGAARRAAASGGAAIGAIVVDGSGRIVGEGHSLVGPDCDPTSHAEMNAIRAATRALGRIQLPDCTLYTTLEPCSMCLGACAWAGLGEVVFGSDGSVAPPEYYDRVDYQAVEHAANARRDGDRQPLIVRGPVLMAETTPLLTDAVAGGAAQIPGGRDGCEHDGSQVRPRRTTWPSSRHPAKASC